MYLDYSRQGSVLFCARVVVANSTRCPCSDSTASIRARSTLPLDSSEDIFRANSLKKHRVVTPQRAGSHREPQADLGKSTIIECARWYDAERPTMSATCLFLGRLPRVHLSKTELATVVFVRQVSVSRSHIRCCVQDALPGPSTPSRRGLRPIVVRLCSVSSH